MAFRLAVPSTCLLFWVSLLQVPGQVPDPAGFLGHEPGERWTRHSRLVAWCRAVAVGSPRVTLIQSGQTYEGRPLLLLTVTHPDNHARMPAIRRSLQRVADPRLLGKGESIASELGGLDQPLAAFNSRIASRSTPR